MYWSERFGASSRRDDIIPVSPPVKRTAEQATRQLPEPVRSQLIEGGFMPPAGEPVLRAEPPVVGVLQIEIRIKFIGPESS